VNRAEHLQWCKDRALEYADAGDTASAMASMMSDLGKHPDTRSRGGARAELMFPLALMGEFEKPGELRKFIEGFN
jgi:hypothetical protein